MGRPRKYNDIEDNGDGTASIVVHQLNGKVIRFLIDSEDVERVSSYTWSMRGGKYANAWTQNRQIRLHRLLMNTPDGMYVDHKDGNTLNNRKANLRNVNHCVNMQNIVNPTKASSSGVRGVHKVDSRYRVRISANHQPLHLGYFDTLEEATRVAIEFKRKLHDCPRLDCPILESD